MISTISLVNIHHHTYLQRFSYEDFKIYSFRNFQIYNTVLFTAVTRLYITSPELTCKTGSLCLLTTFTHFTRWILNITKYKKDQRGFRFHTEEINDYLLSFGIILKKNICSYIKIY